MEESLTHLSDEELHRSLKTLVQDERRHLVAILRRLAEVDRRNLARKKGFPALFHYCLRELRYSEGEAARRVHAARAAAKFQVLYRALGTGRLSLTAVSLLAPHLARGNYRDLIGKALGRSTREVEALVASLAPRHEPAERVRHLGPCVSDKPRPEPEGVAPSQPSLLDAAPQPRPESCARREPVPEQGRVHFSFAADEALLRNVERAKELLRHKYPAAQLEEVFAEAIDALLDRIDPERRLARKVRRSLPRAAPRAAGARSRRIPQRVKDEVWHRDGGRCSFVGTDGRRCATRADLEYDHVRPWSRGGNSDDAANIRLLCRAHNELEARRVLGDAVVDSAIERRKRDVGTHLKGTGHA